MLKKLDLLIVKAFIGPFVATFFITTFVLVLQFMWLYIDDVVGKGIDAFTVLRLLMYVSATMIPLSLPLAVLLSSIMTLGNLGETYELVAIKSAGISLLRFLRPLFVVSLIITIIAFFFNNNILPIANLKMQTLKADIIITKPAFDIKEGVFYDRIEGFVIKIGKKEKDDSTIRNVVIYEQNTSGQQDNMIIADSGTMVVTPDKQNLIFTLKDGWRYQEKGDRGVVIGTELVRMGFKKYKKVLDLSSFKMNQTNDSNYRNNFQMLSIFQLNKNIDSLRKINAKFIDQAASAASTALKFPAYLDTTGWEKVEKEPDTANPYLLKVGFARDSLRKVWVAARHKQDSTDKVQDSVKKALDSVNKAREAAQKKLVAKSSPGHPTSVPPAPGQAGQVLPGAMAANANTHPPMAKEPPDPTLTDLVPDSIRTNMIDRAIGATNQGKVALYQPVALFAAEARSLREHQMAWHEKITLAVACLVMFLIGAPLGSIIRKGGIGMPLVFAVVFFVIFFLLNNFGKKLAGQSVLSPVGGMWMATYVLTPIGLFLIYKALHDSQLFNKEFYFRLSRKIRPLFANWKKAIKIS